MDNPVLCDPDVFPSEKIIFSHLGETKKIFSALFQYNHSAFPDLLEQWKYYNDGKSWLLKVTRKTSTVFWLSVGKEFFRVTFYLRSDAEQKIIDSKLPKKIKDNYLETEGKKFRGITLIMDDEKKLKIYKELLAIKLSIR